jgi:hypothetical protein
MVNLLKEARLKERFKPHPPSPSPFGEGAVQQHKTKQQVLPYHQKNNAEQ